MVTEKISLIWLKNHEKIENFAKDRSKNMLILSVGSRKTVITTSDLGFETRILLNSCRKQKHKFSQTTQKIENFTKPSCKKKNREFHQRSHKKCTNCIRRLQH